MSGVSLATRDRVLRAVEACTDEAVAFTADLLKIPTINPPGEYYIDCAKFIGETLAAFDFAVEYHDGEGRPEHTAAHPRLNVIGRREGRAPRPLVHVNGHFDVVPVGAGWTVDPFGGLVRDGKIYGRGACDMKAGITAGIFAAEAIRRAGVRLAGSLEISGTVDEESGGWAGAALLAQQGRITSDSTDFVVIPEPLNVDRICIGHRGVYWFEVVTHGHIAHGSMPFLGISAIEHMGAVLEAVRNELKPVLASRTTMVPVVPDGARHATINVNTIAGGQVGHTVQSPCVADHCRAIFDRRFLLEEGFDATKAEIVHLLDGLTTKIPGFRYEIADMMTVHPVRTPDGSPLVGALQRGIADILGKEASLIASPGTYDHKHFTRIGGIDHCVAYGPGILDLAHQPDEYCAIDDLVNATRVIALAMLDLAGVDGE